MEKNQVIIIIITRRLWSVELRWRQRGRRANKQLTRKMFTSSGVCGARMEPTRPTSEHAASAELRVAVGNSSAVNTYSALNANVIVSLPTMNRPSPAPA
jgi:hypothetical protein